MEKNLINLDLCILYQTYLFFDAKLIIQWKIIIWILYTINAWVQIINYINVLKLLRVFNIYVHEYIYCETSSDFVGSGGAAISSCSTGFSGATTYESWTYIN